MAKSAVDTVSKTDNVVEAGVEIVCGEFPAIRGEFLLEPCGPILACLRLEIGISRETRIGAEALIEAGLFDSLTVEGVVTRVTEEAFAVAQRVGAANAGHDAGAKIAVGLDAAAEVEREPRNGRVTEVEITGLIVTAQMARRSELDAPVLHFVLVADGCEEIARDIAGLRVDGRAVELEQGIERKTISLICEAVLASVGVRADQLVMPVGAGSEFPTGVGGKNLLAVALKKVRNSARGKRGAGNAGIAGVVTKRDVELVGVGKGVAKISRERAIHEVVVGTLAVSPEIGGGAGIVEFAEDAAEVCATARGGQVPPPRINTECGNASISAVREELDDAGTGIAAVNGTFDAADDFHFVDVFGGDAGKIHGAAGRIDRRTVHEDLGEVGIAAVQKNRGRAAERSRAADSDAR